MANTRAASYIFWHIFWEVALTPLWCLKGLLIATSAYKFSDFGHRELQLQRKFHLIWKRGRCSLNRSKNVLLRRRFLKVYATVFGLVFSCFFSTLPRWVSILTSQSTSTSMSAIVSRKTLYQIMFYNILLIASFGISIPHTPRNISFSFLYLFVLVKIV